MTHPTQELRIAVTPEQMDELTALAEALRISRSELVRTACTHYIEARKAQRSEGDKPNRKPPKHTKPQVVSKQVSQYVRGDRSGSE